MKDKYISGMSEIKADEELKNKLLNINKNIKQSKYYFSNWKIASVFAIALIFVLFFNVCLPYMQNMLNTNEVITTKTPIAKKIFGGFVITAFAADNSSFEVKPNVDFLIGKYQLTMSSVPGFPLKIECNDAESIKVSITDGELLLWNSSDGKIHNKGKELIINSGDTIYWTPLQKNSPNTVVSSSTINIIAYKGDEEIGKNIIKIEAVDRISYMGRMIE